MSFICNIKKVEVGDTKFNFHEKHDILEDNVASAHDTIGCELIQQNINFLKRLQKKINRKVKKQKAKKKLKKYFSQE